jgi:hypothetical protein
MYHTQPKYVFRYRIRNTKARWRGTHGGEGANNSSKTKYSMYRTGILAHVIAVMGVRYSFALPIKYGPVSRVSDYIAAYSERGRRGTSLLSYRRCTGNGE